MISWKFVLFIIVCIGFIAVAIVKNKRIRKVLSTKEKTFEEYEGKKAEFKVQAKNKDFEIEDFIADMFDVKVVKNTDRNSSRNIQCQFCGEITSAEKINCSFCGNPLKQ